MTDEMRSAIQPVLSFPRVEAPLPARSFDVVGLFAGIGGIEVGLHAAGHRTTLLCEIEPTAARVLRARFPSVEVVPDVRELRQIPHADVLVAGFPCQDLSQAGRTAGIQGSRSGLVGEVFRLLESADPTWLLLENVPFMLQLDGGEAMRFLTRSLEALGFRWAYRVVNTRCFGLPQRRQRVLMLASRREDPRTVLFADDAGPHEEPDFDGRRPCGFYWTEGLKGVGWAVDGIPTLKGGSTIGIPSAPAIWFPQTGVVATPNIRDAERLQGFEPGWTEPAVDEPAKRNGPRWKLVGNAVSVPVARWLGERLARPGTYDGTLDARLAKGSRWPSAAWSSGGPTFVAEVSKWPLVVPVPTLTEFLEFPMRPLSVRAIEGFLDRAGRGCLRFEAGFLDALGTFARLHGSGDVPEEISVAEASAMRRQRSTPASRSATRAARVQNG